MDARTDSELVADFRTGHDDAFGEVVERYGEPLLRFARRRLRGTAHEAEDVVQESLVRAFAALRRDNRPMLLRPWLYRIVGNGIVDVLRTPAHGLLDDAQPARRETQDEALERCALLEVVDAVTALPERQRRALILQALEGRSYGAIAVELRTTVPAAKALIARARAGVRLASLADAA